MLRRNFVKATLAGLCGLFVPIKAFAKSFDPFKAQVKGKFTCGPVYYITRLPDTPNMLSIKSLYYDKAQEFVMPEGLSTIRPRDVIQNINDTNNLVSSGYGDLPCLTWDSTESLERFEKADDERLEKWRLDVKARKADCANGVLFRAHENVDGTLCYMRSAGMRSILKSIIS